MEREKGKEGRKSGDGGRGKSRDGEREKRKEGREKEEE